MARRNPQSTETARVVQLQRPCMRSLEKCLEDMLQRVRDGRVTSVLFVVEEVGRREPHYGIVGRYRESPAAAIGHLAIMQEKVKDYAADMAPDLEDAP